MSTARYLIGDVFERMAELPDGSVDLVVTSPPFLALRSYLPADHPDKHKEIGSETTPAEFLDTLLALTGEWRRVLAPHGSIAVELGDTYASSGGTTDNRTSSLGGNDLAPRGPRGNGPGWPLDKSLAGIPTLYAWSLAYGRNLLNPETTIHPWRVRNLLVWARPNPPVGALGDKWRPATSYVTVACVGRSRYFDLDAIRTPLADSPGNRYPRPASTHAKGSGKGKGYGEAPVAAVDYSAGAPPLDWCDERDLDWQPLMPLPTQPYAGSHYATFPTKLPARLIECMAPQRVCRTCGQPSRRLVEHERTVDALATPHGKSAGALHSGGAMTTKFDVRRETLGWSDCGHDNWRPGHVLDPFGGSGTTAVAATGAGRDCTLIDLDARNAELARDRVGMFLEVHP